MPIFQIDSRGKSDAILTARKLAQQYHRDLNIKSVLEILPHELSWSDLAATKKSTVKTCRSLLDQVSDATPSERAAQIETAFDLLNDLAKNLEAEMNFRDGIGDRSERMDPHAADEIGHTTCLAEDGCTWIRADATAPDGFALRKDEPMRAFAKPKPPTGMPDLGISNLCRAMISGPQSDAERRALAEGSDATGGINVPAITSNQLIDALRANLVVNAAGARIIPLSTDSTTIARIASDPVAAFRAEAGAIAESDPTFSAITFTARSLAVMVKASRELLDDSLNINEAMQGVLTKALAAKIDKVALEGSGVAPEPTGLRLQSGIGHTALNAALTNYAPFVTARTGVLSANGGPITAMILHPRDEGKLSGLSDTTGQPLNAPTAIASIPMLTTSAIQIDAGSGNDESTAYIGNFSNLLIGLRNNIRIEILRERFATTHEYAFIAHCRFDIAISHAASFHKISGIQD